MEPTDAVRVAVTPYVGRPGATEPTLLEVHVGLRAVRVTAVKVTVPATLEAVMEAATPISVASIGLSREERAVLPAREPTGTATTA